VCSLSKKLFIMNALRDFTLAILTKTKENHLMFKKLASILGFTLLLFTITTVAAPCSNDKYGSTYTAELPTGGKVRLGINEVTGQLLVGFFIDGQAFGFTGKDSAVYGPHKLSLMPKTFGGAKVFMKSLQVYVLNVSDSEAIFQIDLGRSTQTLIAEVETLASEKVKGAQAGTLKYVKTSTMFSTVNEGAACYFPIPNSNTVPNLDYPNCVNMVTDSDWWNCYRCCAFSILSSQSSICNPPLLD